MLTRHKIFALLALSTTACPSRSGTRATAAPEPTPEPAPAPAAEVAEEPAPAPVASIPQAGPGIPGPELQLARFTTPRELSLHFNEPVTPVGDFDASQFRLSIGASYAEEEYFTLYYYDPGEMEVGEGLLSFDAVAGADTHTLRLELSEPIAGELCEAIVEAAAAEAEMAAEDGGPAPQIGLFLHYDDRSKGGISNRAGARLDDIAPHWVTPPKTEASFSGTVKMTIAAFGPLQCSISGTGRGGS